MGNLREIKRRIKSVKNTSQITKAMQMVASAKMHRAQDQALKGRAYLGNLAHVLATLQTVIDQSDRPLMRQRDTGRDLVIVVNTDRGLCGALNANLFRMVRDDCSRDAVYITLGSKLNVQFAKYGYDLAATWSLGDPVRPVELKPIGDFIRKGFLSGEYKRVLLAYSSFVNVMVQQPTLRTLLPISREELLDVAAQGQSAVEENGMERQYILEPSPEALLDAILPLYMFSIFMQTILEARASEQSARMVSMKAATENANKLIDELTLDYNKARQNQITNELLEITTAMRAME